MENKKSGIRFSPVGRITESFYQDILKKVALGHNGLEGPRKLKIFVQIWM